MLPYSSRSRDVVGTSPLSTLPPTTVCLPLCTRHARHYDNNVITRISGYQRSESVKAVIRGLGRVSVKCQILLHEVKYYQKLYLKSDLLHDIFWAYLINITEDSCCSTVFISLSAAINNIFPLFAEYVNST